MTKTIIDEKQTDGQKTIGVCVGDLDLRNDVRALLSRFCDDYRVVLFETQPCQIELDPRIVRRNILKANSTKFKLLQKFYRLTGEIPSSWDFRRNALHRAKKIVSPIKRFSANLLAGIRANMPIKLSTERLLKWLGDVDQTPIVDVDHVLILTHISSMPFLAKVYRSDSPTWIYIHSWDHICKDTRYPRAANYLVWNEMAKEDLAKLHKIPREKIEVCGSTQLSYLNTYSEASRSKSEKKTKFFYYICGHGYPGNVDQEVQLIRVLAAAIQTQAPDHKLLVRPYPNQSNWEIYTKLQKETSILLDDEFRKGKKGREQSTEDIFAKYDKIREATAVFHAGTTLGLEAAFLGTPVFMFCPFGWPLGEKKMSDHIANVFKFQHLRRYLVKDSPNVIREQSEIELGIRLAIDDLPTALNYNKACADQFQLASIDAVASKILTAITGSESTKNHKEEKVTC